jgi:hypothetical protein
VALYYVAIEAQRTAPFRGMMEQRTFHGPITPQDFARALIAEFDHGNLHARMVGRGENIVVQISSPAMPASGGHTAISVHMSAIEDGVLVRVGQQQWMGVAASLGVTALSALLRPRTLLGRLDDLAQDITSLNLTNLIWKTMEDVAKKLGASYEISMRLRRISCPYCRTANPVGEPHCVACGAPLGDLQPRTCNNCGFVLDADDLSCPNCGTPTSQPA